MKQQLYGIAGAIALAASVAACGGGGGSTPPIPVTQPTTAQQGYSVLVKFSGGNALASQSAFDRRPLSVATRALASTSTQLPVSFSVPAPPTSFFAQDVGQWQGTATIIVSPQPTTAPSAGYALTGVAASVQPLATPTGSSTAPPQAAISATSSASPAAGSLVVTLSGSVSSTATVPTYIVQRSNIACSDRAVVIGPGPPLPSDQYGGVKFASGVALGTSSPSGADLYLDGSWCSGAGFVNAVDTSVTLYAPHGATLVSSATTPFTSVTAAMCGNTFTSTTLTALAQGVSDPVAPKDILLVTDADGKCTKIAMNLMSVGTPPTSTLNGSPAYLDFSFEESGFSVDGF